MSEALRHLGIAEHAAGRLDAAWERLEESVRLRREIGFMPGVAANLVGLAYVAAGQGRRDDALALIDEASSIADASGAQAIVRQVAQARRNCRQLPSTTLHAEATTMTASVRVGLTRTGSSEARNMPATVLMCPNGASRSGCCASCLVLNVARNRYPACSATGPPSSCPP
jgi:hypothetical protein